MKCRTFLRRCLAAGLLLLYGTAPVMKGENAPAPRPPDRREIWVPTDQLNSVLVRNPKAILLSREQYETLLRDAKRTTPEKPAPPRDAILSSASYIGHVDGKVLRVHAQLTVTVLSEHWAKLALPFADASLGEVQIDGDAAISVSAPAPANKDGAAKRANTTDTSVDAVLLLHGTGDHRLTAELTVPILYQEGRNRMQFSVPPAPHGTFQADLPGHAQVETLLPMHVEQLAEATRLMAAISPASPSVALSWRNAADPANSLSPEAKVIVMHTLHADRIYTECEVSLSTTMGSLPAQLHIPLPPQTTVLNVSGAELSRWTIQEGRLEIDLQAGEHTTATVHFDWQQPALGNAEQVTRDLATPSVEGIHHTSGEIHVLAGETVEARELKADAGAEPLVVGGITAAWTFRSGAPVIHATFDRFQPHFSADLDTLVDFKLDAIYIERTVTLHEEKGNLFHTEITLPASEELLTVRSGDQEPDWRVETGQLRLRWSEVAPPDHPRCFVIRSRVEPSAWPSLGDGSLGFQLSDAAIAGAENVDGYVALRADESFRLAAKPSDTLEPRDGRTTPVRGDYAWFRRDHFSLQVTVTRRPGEVFASVTGYALPMEGVLDLHARIAWQFLHAGVRSVRVRVPEASASQFYFEGPQIAERNLTGGMWTITFQKELTGPYNLDVTAQTAITRAADDPSKFSVEVPNIEPLDVQRLDGVWAVEANTETEIQVTSKGMNELDALTLPVLPGYQPKHRVIGVYGSIGANYALSLSGVRHAPAQILSTVVDGMQLKSVLGTSGTIRTLATLFVRAAGAQFLDLTLPPKAHLLSLVTKGMPMKPVMGAAGQVRVQLPPEDTSGNDTEVKVLYETEGAEWKAGDKMDMLALRVPKDVPVLNSAWEVYLPDGYRYTDFQSNLRAPAPSHDRLLVSWLKTAASLEYWRGRFTAADDRKAAANAGPRDWIAPGKSVYHLRDPSESERQRIAEKLRKIILPKVEFHEPALLDVIAALEKWSRDEDKDESDPTRKGVKVTLRLDLDPASKNASALSPLASVSLTDIPLGEAIHYLSNNAGLKYKVVDGGVAIVPLSEPLAPLQVRTFRVPPSIFTPSKENTGSGKEFGPGPQMHSWLASMGLDFPPGSRIHCEPENGRLVMYNTEDNLDLFDAMISVSDSVPGTVPTPLPQAQPAGGTDTIGKLNSIVLPKFELHDVTLHEAVDTLVRMVSVFDADAEPARRGFKVRYITQSAQSSGPGPTIPGLEPVPSPPEVKQPAPPAVTLPAEQRVSLNLKNVPVKDALDAIVHLAGFRYIVGEDGVVQITPVSVPTESLITHEFTVPPSFFSKADATFNGTGLTSRVDAKDYFGALGVTFPPGSSAYYNASTGKLILKDTPDNIDIMAATISAAAGPAAANPATKAWIGDVSGLLPLELELPLIGTQVTFNGLIAPEFISLRYQSWWSRAREHWWELLLGGIVFFRFGQRRPCWGTAWAILLLTAIPVCVTRDWTAACNALLLGWLLALALSGLASLMKSAPERKEVLA